MNSKSKNIILKCIAVSVCVAYIFIIFVDPMISEIRQKSDDFPYIKNFFLLPFYQSVMEMLPLNNDMGMGLAFLGIMIYPLFVGALYGLIIGVIIKLLFSRPNK